MKRIFAFAVVSMLAACGGHSVETVSNPYADRMRDLSRNGIEAMQRERWASAQQSFERALVAAQLANDRKLVAQAWLNLGRLLSAAGNAEQAELALQQAETVAKEEGLDILQVRARLALALLYQQQKKPAWHPDDIPERYPVDVQISAGRLVQLQGDAELARRYYQRVISHRGKERMDEVYRAEAHMGMALLARNGGDTATVVDETGRVLDIARRVGTPRMAAHALMMRGEALTDRAERRRQYEQALAIYRPLGDRRGERAALQALIEVTADDGQRERWRRALESLEKEEK